MTHTQLFAACIAALATAALPFVASAAVVSTNHDRVKSYADAPPASASITERSATGNAGTRSGSQSVKPRNTVGGKNAHRRKNNTPGQGQRVTQLQTVQVTGLRQSMASAENIKASSHMIVDAVVAESIGKLPDNSVAAALQRITGVQVIPDVIGQEGGVSIRGLPDVETTVNGISLFSADGRKFDLENMPATSVRAIKVYKTSNAAMLDGGMAGTIDLITWKPFDFHGRKVAVTFNANHREAAHTTDPALSALFSDRWDTKFGQFGALIGASASTIHAHVGSVNDAFPELLKNGSQQVMRTSDGSLISVPSSFTETNVEDNRKQASINYSLQWRPSRHLTFELSGFYDWFRDPIASILFFSNPVNAGVTPTGLQVSNNCYANQLPGAFHGQKVCDASSASWTGNTYSASSTQAPERTSRDGTNTLSVAWQRGRWSLSSHFTHESSYWDNNSVIVDNFIGQPITTVWSTENNRPNWQIANDPQNVAKNYYLNGLFQQWEHQGGSATFWRADGKYRVPNGPIRDIQFGFRYSNHVSTDNGSTQISTPPPGGPFGSSPADPTVANNVLSVFGPDYFCAVGEIPYSAGSPLSGCYGYLRHNAGAIRRYYGLSSGDPDENPGRFFNIQEKKYTGYSQVHYRFPIFGITVSGLIGLRAERLLRRLRGFAFNAKDATYTPLTDYAHNWSYLPNFSMDFSLPMNLLLRLDYSKTITYPPFNSLSPALSLNPGTINRPGLAHSGNPNLQPLRSKNYDGSLEWYFSNDGYVGFEAFYRKDTGFITNHTTILTTEGQQFNLTAPESAGREHFKGGGIVYQQFFSGLPGWLNGLGVQLNYTKILGTGVDFSKNNGNAILMYERGRVSARIAYNFRSDFISGFSRPVPNVDVITVQPPNMLDVGLQYKVSKSMTVSFSGVDLNGATMRTYWGNGTARPQTVTYEGRTFSVGIRLTY